MSWQVWFCWGFLALAVLVILRLIWFIWELTRAARNVAWSMSWQRRDETTNREGHDGRDPPVSP